jgi:UTP:GlnB (protein PII) uridylyltransferase
MMPFRRRRATSAQDRIATAPPGYARTQSRADLVRHAALLDPLPRTREVRVATTPGRIPGTWNLDVAARDQPGLLARFTGVLAAHGIDVVQAVIATWDDGAALQAFVVRSGEAPDAREFERALERPLLPQAIEDATAVYDNDASPDYTLCEVTAPDRPGLLHAIAVHFATSGVDIHAAAVTTVDGVARDRFDLTDSSGRQLCFNSVNSAFQTLTRF